MIEVNVDCCAVLVGHELLFVAHGYSRSIEVSADCCVALVGHDAVECGTLLQSINGSQCGLSCRVSRP